MGPLQIHENIDVHRSYIHDLSSFEIKAWKKIKIPEWW